MNGNEQLYDIADELIILPKAVLDIFLKSKKPADLISLYTFYYYTAKWQKTNRPKCTTGYVSKGLKWGDDKVRRVKKELVKIGLIKDVTTIDAKTKKVKGWYIKINYIFKRETVDNIIETHHSEKPECGKSHSVETRGTNALSSNNINALSSNNINALSSNNKENNKFDIFWNKYDKKIDRTSCLKKWNKLNKSDINNIMETVSDYVKSKPDKQYRPNPLTYLNNKRWEDEIIYNNKPSYNNTPKQQNHNIQTLDDPDLIEKIKKAKEGK